MHSRNIPWPPNSLRVHWRRPGLSPVISRAPGAGPAGSSTLPSAARAVLTPFPANVPSKEPHPRWTNSPVLSPGAGLCRHVTPPAKRPEEAKQALNPIAPFPKACSRTQGRRRLTPDPWPSVPECRDCPAHHCPASGLAAEWLCSDGPHREPKSLWSSTDPSRAKAMSHIFSAC